MFEKLLDLLLQGGERISPFVVLNPYDGGVVLRLGLYHRTLGPGLHWKYPLLEHVLVANTCVDTLHLPPQTVTTRDYAQVGLSAIVRYTIPDVKPFLLDVIDQRTVLCDVTLGLTRKAVEQLTFQELVTTSWETAVRDQLRRRVERFGFRVEEVTYADLGKLRSFRLYGERASL